MFKKIKDYLEKEFFIDNEIMKCNLNPFLRSYYDGLNAEQVDEALKNVRGTIRNNKIYIKFLKSKLKESKNYCSYVYSQYETLLQNEILDKEYINNTGEHIIQLLKYKKKKFKEIKECEDSGKKPITDN